MRRMLAAAVVMVAAVAGCAQVKDQPTEQPRVVLPTGGTDLVAQLRYIGGFVPVSWSLISAPRVSVYADGMAVAHANRTLRLTADEVTALVTTLRRNLTGLGPTVTAEPSQAVADAPTSVIEVLGADGKLQSVSAYALGAEYGYPDRLVAAQDELMRVSDRALNEGEPFTSARVRLVAQEQEPSVGGTVRPWPAAVALPAKGANGGRVANLSGGEATAVRRAWPKPIDPVQAGAWPVARRPDGSLFGVAWRYVLPHE